MPSYVKHHHTVEEKMQGQWQNLHCIRGREDIEWQRTRERQGKKSFINWPSQKHRTTSQPTANQKCKSSTNTWAGRADRGRQRIMITLDQCLLNACTVCRISELLPQWKVLQRMQTNALLYFQMFGWALVAVKSSSGAALEVTCSGQINFYECPSLTTSSSNTT